MEFDQFTIKQLHEGLVKKEFSSTELTSDFLNRIREKDKAIHAFLSLNSEEAIGQAEKVDEMISQGEKIDVLSGIPCAVKDNILVENLPATAGSKILENYIAPYDATAIKKLKEKKSIFLGKTNLDEFAMGSSTENSAFGPTKNPVDLNRVPGGSSGGSAAAVKAGMCAFALGSDTGGSIRQPASFCGVVGLKPTYGAVSRYGLMAMASSLDQIGPITKTVEDAEIVFDAMAGYDLLDSTSVKFPIPDLRFKIQGLRIGIPKEYFQKGLDPKVDEAIKKAIKQFEDLGASIEEISLPHTSDALASYYLIMPSEVSANLARYDGIKYGLSKEGDDLISVYLNTRKEGLGQEVRRRVMLGAYALSAGYYDAFYLKAQKVRALIKQDFEKAFSKVDLLLTPTSPQTAFKFGEKTADPLAMYLADIYTVPVNLAGLPAISIPVEPVGGLPIGLQIIGRWFEEKLILKAAQELK
ncbi:MAG: Asp-tRNA(Asn)/Glu-tRNA(Gln) amidotransferase subunit GatA [Parcubacteria group bacterium]|nr:Asp-tRNA(Asn)/Glu-tRNA(Gln) amidotransferase subunit GatA [Parcubacteria group bacterium]